MDAVEEATILGGRARSGRGGALAAMARLARSVGSWEAHRWPWFSLAVLTTASLVALLAPWLAPHPPESGDLAARLTPPSWAGGTAKYLLGTDELGRDMASRMIFGARISLLVAIAGIAVAGSVGGLVGLVSGYFGGWVDDLIQRLVEISSALPAILLAMVLGLVLGPGFENIVLVATLVYWGRFARQVRGEVLSVKERDYVALARIAGGNSAYVMFRHILPNILDTATVVTTLIVGHLILLESTLSYLGIGVPPPAPSWGNMVAAGRGVMVRGWWVSLFPGMAILLVVLAFNLLGDWLRDRRDPRLR